MTIVKSVGSGWNEIVQFVENVEKAVFETNMRFIYTLN
jgi:hypothetical protein